MVSRVGGLQPQDDGLVAEGGELVDESKRAAQSGRLLGPGGALPVSW